MKFTLRSKEDVWQAIRRRGKELASKLKDREIFTSAEFANYATRLADFILRNHKLYSLEICYDTNDAATVAYTDGKKIVLNTGNSLARHPKLLERRFKVNMGILFHEVAHKLFIDFKVHNKIMDTLLSGQLFGDFPDQLSAEQDAALAEIRDVMASPYCMALTKLFSHISNCVNDGHDENAMKRCFTGFIPDCITTAGEVQMECAPYLAEAIGSRASDYSIYSSLILSFAKYGSYKVLDVPEEQPYLDKMQEVEPIIDAALLEDDYALRWNHINSIVLFLWPCVRDKFPKNPQNQQVQQSSQSGLPSQGGSSSGSSSSGQPSSSGNNQTSSGCNQQSSEETSQLTPGSASAPSPEEVASELEEAAQQVQQSMSAAPAPVNGTGSAVATSQIANNPSPSVQSGSEGLAQITQALGEEKAASQVQKELDQAQMEAIRNCNVPLVHKNVKCRVIRHNTPDEQKYKQISTEIASLVRNLSKQMLDLFRELNTQSVQHHRKYGPIIEATEAYRPDGTFFAKKKLPMDLPDMALCVLIDQSGSMYGTKLEAATKTAILLEQFANNIGVPLMVAGHDVSGSGVRLRIFTDFVSAMSEKDKYSLAGIESGGCNRDGLPIRLCCELLEQRPEKIRLMVVISDGSPYDTGYSGKEAMKDISDTVKEFRKKGLEIYGAAIDDDREIIQSIYGKNFLSITNLEMLPKTLVRLVRQRIV